VIRRGNRKTKELTVFADNLHFGSRVESRRMLGEGGFGGFLGGCGASKQEKYVP
jgi:hypothetical protein